MSRKEASFDQLIEYLDRDSARVEDFELYQNLFARDQNGLVDEFEDNAAFLKTRKNGNFMYHEILSVSPSSQLSRDQQKEILRQIAQKYMEERAKYNLVYAVLHDDHEHHLHYHFLISANEMRDQKRTRLSKTKFDKIKKDLERHVLQKFPEMEQEKLIGNKSKLRVSQKELEMKRRTGKPSKKDLVRITLGDIFEKSVSAEDFYKRMEAAGFEIYQRKTIVGVRVLGQKNPHRLETLGVLEAWKEAETRLGLVIGQKPKMQKAEPKQEQSKKGGGDHNDMPKNHSQKNGQKRSKQQSEQVFGFSQQRKAEIAEILKGIFEHSRSAAEILEGLERHKLSIVERGRYLGVKDLDTGREIALRDLKVGVRKEESVKDGFLHHEVSVKYVDENLHRLYEDSKKRIWGSKKQGKEKFSGVDGAEEPTDSMFGKIGKVFKKAFGTEGQEPKPEARPDQDIEHFEDSSVRFGENGSVTEEIEKRRADMERFRQDQSGTGKSRENDHEDSDGDEKGR